MVDALYYAQMPIIAKHNDQRLRFSMIGGDEGKELTQYCHYYCTQDNTRKCIQYPPERSFAHLLMEEELCTKQLDESGILEADSSA